MSEQPSENQDHIDYEPGEHTEDQLGIPGDAEPMPDDDAERQEPSLVNTEWWDDEDDEDDGEKHKDEGVSRGD